MKQKIILIISVVVIGAGIVGWWQYALSQIELSTMRQLAVTSNHNEKVVKFLDLFVNHVLGAKEEVAFDKRLRLENAVRDTGDQELMASWHNFVGSKDEQAAQEEVRKLLILIAEKLSS